jgi:hypothetical protein
LGAGAAYNPGNPYANGTIDNQGGFVTLGAADFLTTLGAVSRAALQSAWVEKWARQRRLRPEVFGLRVDQVDTGDEQWPIDAQCLPANNPVTAQIKADNSNALLPLAYPEGSPTHPSYPAGHAALAGANCTVLKAFFDGSQIFGQGKLPAPVQSSTDGQTLLPFVGPSLTLNGEINKLASNVAIARNIAGVHYRSDGDQGILLGERVAVQFLRDQATTYNEPIGRWTITGFRGDEIVIVE